MKKLRTKLFAIFIVAALLFSFYPIDFNAIAPSNAAEKNIHIGVDYRIELLTIMQLIGGFEYSEKPLNFPYKESVDEYFGPHRRHPAVKRIIEFKNNSKYFNTSVDAVLYFSQPPECKQLVPFSPEILDHANGEENLIEFANALRHFANETKFTDFMEQQKDTFDTMKTQTDMESKGATYLQQLESYYGIKQHSYNIVLAPFIHCGGFGPSIKLEDGSRDIFSVIGPCSVKDGIPYFRSEKDFEEIIFHEFSHSFVNPLTDKYKTKVNECIKLYSPISRKMERMRYGEWPICLNEHLVRTFTTRITDIMNGEEEAKIAEEIEVKRGFVYIPLLLEKYKMFENNRTKYTNFEEFYLYLLQYLKELCQYPCIPTDLEANSTKNKTIQLKWKDNSQDETGFRVYRSEDPLRPFETLQELPENITSFVDETVQQDVLYWYKVTAFNEKGEMCTGCVTCIINFIKPRTVKTLNLEYAKGKEVKLNWDYNTFCKGFLLYEVPNNTVMEQIDKEKRSIILENVSFGEHTYKLCAYNECKGERKMGREAEITVLVLKAPSNIQAKALGTNSIEVSWLLPSTKVDDIEVLRKIEGSEFETIRTLKKLSSFVDRRLEPDTEYEYKVIAKIGELITSAESEIVKVKTEAEKEAPPPEQEEIILKFQIGNNKYWVNEECKEMDVPPMILEGRTFLPIRYVTEPIGAKISWDGVESKITVELEETIIELWIGNNTAKINGVEAPIDKNNPGIKPVIVSGRTLLPLRFVGESLGCEMEWNPDAQEITLTYTR